MIIFNLNLNSCQNNARVHDLDTKYTVQKVSLHSNVVLTHCNHLKNKGLKPTWKFKKDKETFWTMY